MFGIFILNKKLNSKLFQRFLRKSVRWESLAPDFHFRGRAGIKVNATRGSSQNSKLIDKKMRESSALRKFVLTP